MKERLQKIIAAAGIASRRHAEELIAAGRVSVNGEVIIELAPGPTRTGCNPLTVILFRF